VAPQPWRNAMKQLEIPMPENFNAAEGAEPPTLPEGEDRGPKDLRTFRPETDGVVSLRAAHTLLQFALGLTECNDEDRDVLTTTLIDVEARLRRARAPR